MLYICISTSAFTYMKYYLSKSVDCVLCAVCFLHHESKVNMSISKKDMNSVEIAYTLIDNAKELNIVNKEHEEQSLKR